ncbi:Hypp4715 [Branchiostoma lanceolatum]|uniref:Hypp4715 protein n=1 Tax=Branchiostoma lanceolatum TaxID=7740 RepID=A0A8K0AD91_BRALA|nr:Hypp4715 [Branchiostoma lanceolatum]
MKACIFLLVVGLVTLTTVYAYVDEYTDTLTGCECWFDSSRWDCACCRPGGCQCWVPQPHRCIPCGTNCGDYPSFPWSIDNGVEHHVASSCHQCVWTVMTMFQSISIPAGFVTKTYSPSDDDLTNPERGWWKYQAVKASDYIVLSVSRLQTFRSEGHTLIFRYFVLDLFVNSDISAAFLTNLQADLDNARQAGVKIIPRFSYTQTSGDSTDAPLSQALRHVAQLKPYLQANGDVIAVLQAGFIGTWGEWYYSDNYSTLNSVGNPIVVTDDDWARRVTLLDAVLDAVPNDRMVQIRYMKYKKRFTDDDSPLTESEGRSGSKKARIGHHNDCFLASDRDWGTFQDLTVDYPYLSADTTYTVMGGETCNYNPPRSSCDTAERELALFHWSYLNPGFQQDVTNEWKQQGCYDRIGRHLGYRLELVSGTYRSAVPQGGTFCGRLEIRNVGYAAPFNPRQVKIVLQKDSVIVTSLVVTGVDPRDWHPGSLHSVPISVQLPSNLASGNYQVFLWLSDPSPTISDRPEFSILLANTGVPDPLTGLNNLGHTLQVQPTGADSPSC